MTLLLDQGVQFSAALDPHRRLAYERALVDALALYKDELPTIAVLGWQATTLLDVFSEKVSKITIIEDEPLLVASIKSALEEKQLGEKVRILESDPRTATLDEKVDIILLTHSSTWFIEGPSAAVLDNARKNLLKAEGQMIPRRFVHLFELACCPTSVNGLEMRVPRYIRPGEPVPLLSESKHWSTIDFGSNATIKHDVEDTIIVKSLLTGTLTGLRLSTLVEISKDNIYLASHAGYHKVFVPLEHDINVEAGKLVEIFVKYSFSAGLTQTLFKGRIVGKENDQGWSLHDHSTTQAFRAKIRAFVDGIKEQGRLSDLDKVVSYTIDPHGDVSRLTAMFWTIDEEFRKPVRDLIASFRADISQVGPTPSDDTIYDLMLETYNAYRAN